MSIIDSLGIGSGASATVTMQNNSVGSITIIDGGSGYTKQTTRVEFLLSEYDLPLLTTDAPKTEPPNTVPDISTVPDTSNIPNPPTNNPPTGIILSQISITENLGAGTELATISATDSDQNESHTYILIDGDGDEDNSSFVINGDTILIAHSFDYELKDSYSIRLQVTDRQGNLYQQSFTIQVVDDTREGWFYFTNLPYVYTASPSSWHYAQTLSNSFWWMDLTKGEWVQKLEGLIPSGRTYNDGQTAGTLHVQNNSLSYGLSKSDTLVNAISEAQKSAYDLGYTNGREFSEFAPDNLQGKVFTVIDDDGVIARWSFHDGLNGTAESILGAVSVMYIYNKTSSKAATFTLNANTTITSGEILFSSPNNGTISATSKDIIDETEDQGTASFTIE